MSVREFAEELIKYYNSINETYGPLVAYHIQEKLKEITDDDSDNYGGDNK